LKEEREDGRRKKGEGTMKGKELREVGKVMVGIAQREVRAHFPRKTKAGELLRVPPPLGNLPPPTTPSLLLLPCPLLKFGRLSVGKSGIS